MHLAITKTNTLSLSAQKNTNNSFVTYIFYNKVVYTLSNHYQKYVCEIYNKKNYSYKTYKKATWENSNRNTVWNVDIQSLIIDSIDSIDSLKNLTSFLSKFTFLLIFFKPNISIFMFLINVFKLLLL